MNTRNLLVAGTIGLVSGVDAWTTVHAQAAHVVSVSDFQSLKAVDWHMEISPEGGTLAYVVANEIWLVPTAGGAARRVASGVQPRWAPDGTRLAFYSSASGTLQLWVVDPRTGINRQVTKQEGGIEPDARVRFSGWVGDPLRYAWSPDGTQLVFSSQKEIVTGTRPAVDATPQASHADTGSGYTPIILTAATPASWTLSGIFRNDALGPRFVNGRFTTAGDDTNSEVRRPPRVNQLFVVDVAGGAISPLTDDGANYFNPDWSPDGRTIVCASTEGQMPGLAGSTNIYAIDVRGRTKRALTTGRGIKRLPYWSPDGLWIAYVNSDAGMQSVRVVSHEGGDSADITARLHRTVQMFYWSPDSTSVVVSAVDGVSRPLVRISRTGRLGSEGRIAGNAVYWPATLSKSGVLAWQLGEGTHVGRLYASSGLADKAVLIADLNPQMNDWAVGYQEVVRWKNRSGDELEGILIKPVGFEKGRRYPTIVDPYSSMTNSFMSIGMMGNQTFAGRGYAVFFPNVRAPHIVPNLLKNVAYSAAGRGSRGVDVLLDDVLSGVDALVKMGIADSERLGLIGFSNGGGSVNQLVTKTDRFKCAVSASGAAVDWPLAFLLNSDTTFYPRILGNVAPWDNPAEYTAVSPIYRLNGVKIPMLLAVGDREPNEFLLPVIEMYNGLRYLKRDVTLLRYPDQGHGFTGSALEDYVRRVQAFLDQHLKAR